MRLARAMSACLRATLAVGGAASTTNVGTDSIDNTDVWRWWQYTVTGFGRGNALHLTTCTSNFVITYGEIVDTCQVIATAGQKGRSDLLTCRVTSPVTGTAAAPGLLHPAHLGKLKR
jgi:hypothetical protein